jgi:hypothetical protein
MSLVAREGFLGAAFEVSTPRLSLTWPVELS